MTYPVGARIRYRDQVDGAVGEIRAYGEDGGERYYEVQWSDYTRIHHHTAHFVETEFEVF